MRAVAARVSQASVSVEDRVVAEISEGLLVLLGVRVGDEQTQAVRMARKLRELRVLDDERSCADAGAPLLVVSQFTLYGDTRKGRRPSWSQAARPAEAQPLVDAVVRALREAGSPVETGIFGARMRVQSVNEGPFTVLVEV